MKQAQLENPQPAETEELYETIRNLRHDFNKLLEENSETRRDVQ